MALGTDTAGLFDAATEYWRNGVEAQAGDLPMDFLMAWISRESDGNPCSYTGSGESGIAQLMPGDNIAAAGTSIGALRVACVGSTMKLARPLTSSEEYEQVRSLIQYVNYVRQLAHTKLDAAGVTWDESTPDFWQFVKLQHNSPGPTLAWLQNATQQLGTPPASWADFRSTVSGYTSELDNAESVGSYGAGGGSIFGGAQIAGMPVTTLALAGLVAWGTYVLLTT